MKKIPRHSSQAIGLTLAMVGAIHTLPVQAAQLNFDESETESNIVTPEATNNCEQESHSNLTSQSQTLELGAHLLASHTVVSSDSGLLQPHQTRVAQAFETDCCAVGGAYEDAAICELGGVPPTGGAAPGGFPYPVLAALAPAAAVPVLISGGDPDPTPTPTPHAHPDSYTHKAS